MFDTFIFLRTKENSNRTTRCVTLDGLIESMEVEATPLPSESAAAREDQGGSVPPGNSS